MANLSLYLCFPLTVKLDNHADKNMYKILAHFQIKEFFGCIGKGDMQLKVSADFEFSETSFA